MNTELAPIGICTYKRLTHLKKTIQALKNNFLSERSELFIFSDAASTGDEESVDKLRKYLNTITGFKKVHIINRTKNCRINNCRGGFNQLLESHERVIFMEEDIITAPSFLLFMNSALNFYKDNKDVFSISGYTPPLDLDINFSSDFFSLRRFSAWSFAIWKNRVDQVDKDFDQVKYLNLINDVQLKSDFCKFGLDMLPMLKKQAEGIFDAGDVKFMFHQFWSNQMTIYPKKSLVKNIGHDGSGVHCCNSTKFDVELWDQKGFNFTNDISPKIDIIKSNFEFRFSPNKLTQSLMVENIINQIDKYNFKSFSLWGTGEISHFLMSFYKEKKQNINFFIDSNANRNDLFMDDQQVITPEEAIRNGETNFVLTSFVHREFMRNKLTELSKSNDLKIIYFDIFN